MPNEIGAVCPPMPIENRYARQSDVTGHEWNFDPPSLYKVLDGVADRLKQQVTAETSGTNGDPPAQEVCETVSGWMGGMLRTLIPQSMPLAVQAFLESIPESPRPSTQSIESTSSENFESARSSTGSTESNFGSVKSPGEASDLELESPRSSPAAIDFDVDAVALVFDRCLVGLQLNLCELTAKEMNYLKALTPDDWLALYEAARADAGEGIRSVEMQADMLESLIGGMEKIPRLESVSVWAPQEGGKLDFGHLQGNNLTISLLGTPDRPLDIVASRGVKIEAGFGSNAALKASRVFPRDGDEVSESWIPLAVPAPPAPVVAIPAAHVAAGYGVLRGYLIKTLNELRSHSAFLQVEFDARAVADAILRCGRFDETGAFGFDFSTLDANQARLAQALPVEAFTALQEYAAGNAVEADPELVADHVHWIRQHGEFPIDVTRLREFAPLLRLYVSAPKQSSFINLAQLQGGEVLLLELIVQTPRPLGILVGKDVEVRAAEGTPAEAIARSEVIHLDEYGKPVGQPCPLLPPEPANSPTKV